MIPVIIKEITVLKLFYRDLKRFKRLKYITV